MSRRLPPGAAAAAVAAGGLLGTLGRFALTGSPVSELTALALVNGAGTLALAVLLSALHGIDSARASGWRLFAGTGVCGSLTTCSALGIALLRTDPATALLAGAGFAVGGTLCAGLGWWAGRRLRPRP
ncbi:CrcB family protein [Brevibacterium sp. NPDC049920]|uniref:Fluoride-specific ion channel n=1 Tax=Brevibacterium pityocampae TaxID=506594 RepID=A0ABP8JP18_9MICO|nr:CrcB family protein [uncultured Brevibacterium sp.]